MYVVEILSCVPTRHIDSPKAIFYRYLEILEMVRSIKSRGRIADDDVVQYGRPSMDDFRPKFIKNPAILVNPHTNSCMYVARHFEFACPQSMIT
ncbi:hypothetical protein AVEN_260869-1 [Araneus ventricosus]|uniref:Uncharacterized protein n=1 Tax=Araneus ventricosus TaxID=182803 RepID=A0A4Y2VB68_ARAVE|nr:hypothetical protein AVEN_260869-1 [Araneus ventricosus]